MGGAVIAASHTGVKKAFMEVLPDQIGFVIDQFKDIDRTAEGTHGCSDTGLLVNSQGCLLTFMLHIALCDNRA